MKRSEINQAIKDSITFFKSNGWALPPTPRWDVTDFGLGDFRKSGLVLINLAEEPDYCEKLMYASINQVTPAHAHKKKKEDIICRT
jgi:D-lyxose ketol-isomerase